MSAINIEHLKNGGVPHSFFELKLLFRTLKVPRSRPEILMFGKRSIMKRNIFTVR